MDIQLIRIDDRLIHGQVVITWATALNSESILLCDNSVYENDWEKELYLSCSPEYLKITILNVAGTAKILKDNSQDFSKTIMLVNGPEVIEELLAMGVDLTNINVGGIHFKEGRDSFLSYLYLNKNEKESFKRCMDKGISFECLDVPTGNKVDLCSLIK
ncbi:MAG: PTS mannose/fructose/sorbose transporter subunit IIB [Calditrichaeota bacterium]|nr:MAG: PTS mannose/fructose/sorbose transporter subunit IIB [Calditrichota bacterium]MBL1207125.1 PTS mannose/fructose/sorbose transporter subunit IIB [Calditrichota bacterium]NOG46955.1 PTS sugar transporter subunit IIB [Calditrichota bacterium]